MAKYTTCLKCGSVEVNERDVLNQAVLVCDECGNSESMINPLELAHLDSFDTLTGSEVKELRA